MIYQWYIFLIILFAFLIGCMANFCTEIEYAGTIQKQYKWLPILVLIIPLIFLAGFRGTMNGFGDSVSYILSYRNIPTRFPNFQSVFLSNAKDKGFWAFSYICRSIFGENYNWYLTIIAAISIFLICLTYKKYSVNFFLSAFLFVASGDYIQWGYNGIRQFLAASIIFGSIDLLLKKKYIPFLLIVLLASTIHFSALIIIPIVFVVQGKAWNKRTLFFIILVIFIVFFIDRFTDFFSNVMESTQYRHEVSQFEKSKGTNILRVLVFSIPSIISLINVDKIRKLDHPLINLCVGMSIATTGFYVISSLTSGLFLGRLTLYFSLFNYILLPWEIKYLFSPKLSRQLQFVMIGFYLVYYYYQVSITWNL